MNWIMIIAGFILLSNPVINVVDILPDAIGFFLIARGMTNASYFIDGISRAKEGFIKLGFLGCVKFFSIALIPYISGSGKMLLAFVFGVLELMWFLPAITAMFDGLSFMELWYGSDTIYAKKVKRSKKEIEYITTTKRYIIFFYILRIVMTLVPELTELQLYDNIGTVSALSVQLINYKPTLYILAAFITVVFGIILIVKTSKYFGRISKDKALAEALESKFKTDILVKTNVFTAKDMKTALVVFIVSAITEFMITADGVNLMVGVIPAVLLIAAVKLIMKHEKKAFIVIPFAALRGVFAIINFILQINYFDEYSVEAVDWITTAYDKYYRMASVNMIEKIFALASVILFLVVLMKAIKNNLNEFGIITEHTQYSKKNRDLETYNTIGGKILMCTILGIINYIFAASYNYMAVNISLTLLINSVVTIIYIAYVVYTVNTINELLYNKELEL